MVNGFSYEIKNEEELNRLLNDIAKIPLSRFVMGEAARIIKKFTKANFILQGSGKYPPLSERYAKRKSRLRPQAPILVYDGDLRDSLVGNTQDSILEIGKAFLIIGTKLPYAIFLNDGTKNMPARKPIFISEKMVEQIEKVYQAHLNKEINKLGLS